MKIRDAFMDVWQWIPIRDGDRIQSTVVTTRSKATCSQFLDHMKRRCPLAVGWVDNAMLNHVLHPANRHRKSLTT